MSAAPGGLVVLRCARVGCSASKRWQWNPTLREWLKFSYNAGAKFYATAHAPTNLRELADLLEHVQRDPLALVVRGELTAAALELVAAGKPILRRKRPRGTALPTLAEVPRQWIMIDVDGWPLPSWADLVDDPEAVIEAAIIDLLPETFHDAVCWWQLSSSAGFVPGVLKVHLFFWLAGPASNEEIKVRLRPVVRDFDGSPFCANQPHYIAAPIIQGGPDPLPRRTGWRKGLEPDVMLPPLQPRQTTGSAGRTPNFRLGEGVDGALAFLGDGPGLRGFHEPLRTATMRYARDSRRLGDRDDAALKRRLRQAIEAAPVDSAKRSGVAEYLADAYLDHNIGGAFDLLTADAHASAQIANATTRLPGPADGPLLLFRTPEAGQAGWTATGHETWIGGGAGLTLPTTRRVVLCRVDDKPWSPADRLHRRMVDEWRAAGVDLVVAWPWPELRSDGSDFADTFRAGGADAVRVRIAAALDPGQPPPRRLPAAQARRALDEAVARFFTAAGAFNNAAGCAHAEAEAAEMAKGDVTNACTRQAGRAAQARARKAVKKAVAAQVGAPPVHAARADVGTGKSAAARFGAAEMLARMRANGDERTIVLAVPTHKLGEEQAGCFVEIPVAREAGLTAAIWRGREAPDPEAPRETMCRRLDAVRDAQTAGASVQSACCKSKLTADGFHGGAADIPTVTCPFFDVCGYHRQQKAKADLWIVAHELLFTEKPAAIGKVAAVIVDEAAWQDGLEGVTGHGITLAIDTLQSPGAIRAAPAETERLRYLRGLAFDALAGLSDGPLIHEAFEVAGLSAAAAAEARALEWMRKVDPAMHPAMTTGERKAAVKAAEGNITIRRLAMFWTAIEAMLADGGPQASGWATLAVEADDKGVVRVLRLKGRRPIREGWQAPTLILDATLNVDLVRPFWPVVELTVDIAVATPHQHIAQIVDSSFSKRRLAPRNDTPEADQRRRLRKLRDLHAALAALGRRYAPDKVLVVVQQAIEAALPELGRLPSNIILAHHNAIAGRDEWRDVAALVVVGRTAAACRRGAYRRGPDRPRSHAAGRLVRARRCATTDGGRHSPGSRGRPAP